MKVRTSNSYEWETLKTYSDMQIIVDSNYLPKHLSFDRCKFIFTTGGSLNFIRCKLTNSNIIGLKTIKKHSNFGHLTMDRLKEFSNNNISLQFNYISFIESDFYNLVDNSICNKMNIKYSNFYNFIIHGKCKDLTIDNVLFSKRLAESYWNKIIFSSAGCHKVIFDDVKINPFYLATKCVDKTSLDLTRAILTDDWSMLRKKYAGINLLIVFVLTLVFFLPIMTRSFFLLFYSNIDPALLSLKKVSLWKAILYGGKEGLTALLYALLTIILVTYNIARLYMTLSIAKLKEEESFLRDSNFNLVSIHPEKYKHQLKIHKVLKFFFILSVLYSFLKLYDTLLIQVPLFK